MALPTLKIDLETAIYNAFEGIKAKTGYDLEGEINKLPPGVFRKRFRDVLLFIKLIFESYDSLINELNSTSDLTLTTIRLNMIREGLNGNGKLADGLKKRIGVFLNRKEFIDKIDALAMCEFLINITKLMAQQTREVNNLNLDKIRDEDKAYFNLNFLIEQITEFPNNRIKETG